MSFQKRLSSFGTVGHAQELQQAVAEHKTRTLLRAQPAQASPQLQLLHRIIDAVQCQGTSTVNARLHLTVYARARLDFKMSGVHLATAGELKTAGAMCAVSINEASKVPSLFLSAIPSAEINRALACLSRWPQGMKHKSHRANHPACPHCIPYSHSNRYLEFAHWSSLHCFRLHFCNFLCMLNRSASFVAKPKSCKRDDQVEAMQRQAFNRVWTALP